MRHLALLVLAVVALPALALTNVDLYRSEVVLDQTVENPDSQARVEGMKEVIVRASGDREAISNEVVQKALKQNSQYLSQISYGQIEGEQSLRMVFSTAHIRSLLSQAQLPVWPAERANILVWLVEESSTDRSIIWEHSTSENLVRMRSEAEKRGLPMTLPVGDFDDITGVEVSDLWGGFARPVGEASQRYPVEGVLVVRAQNGGLRWTLYDQVPSTIGITRQAPISGSNSGLDAANKMINQISDYFARKSAVMVASESSESIKARFTNLNNAVDFFTLENNLKKLSSVAAIDILKIQGNEVTFNIHLLSSEQEFEQEVLRSSPVIKLESVIEESFQQPMEEFSQPEALGRSANSLSELEQTAPQIALDPNLEPVQVLPSEHTLMFEWQSRAPVSYSVEEEPATANEPESVIVNGVQEVDVVE